MILGRHVDVVSVYIKKAAALSRLPEFNPEVTFDLSVDDVSVATALRFRQKPGEHWGTATACLPAGLEPPESAMIDLVFSAAVSGRHPTTPLSAVVRDIRFVQAAECEGQLRARSVSGTPKGQP